MAPPAARFRACFVCSGNICRSPMAEAVFRDIVERAGFGDAVEVSSAGTGEWHVGEPADPRAQDALTRGGHDGTMHRAKVFDPSWFTQLDLVIGLDRTHVRALQSWAPTAADRAKVHSLLEFDPAATSADVPDPYYSDAGMFDAVLATIERGCEALFRQLEPGLSRGATA
jgi:protein-tyrosine phosphatase